MTNECNCGKVNSCKPCKRAYDASRRDMVRERDRNKRAEYHKANKEAIRKKVSLWAENNKVRHAARCGETRVKKYYPHCLVEGYDFEATIPFYAERIRLTQETGTVHHVDHIVSLANGGKHEASNLQVLTAAENITKG